jgi:hypothetical protein
LLNDISVAGVTELRFSTFVGVSHGLERSGTALGRDREPSKSGPSSGAVEEIVVEESIEEIVAAGGPGGAVAAGGSSRRSSSGVRRGESSPSALVAVGGSPRSPSRRGS